MPKVLPPSPCTAKELSALAANLEQLATRLNAVAVQLEEAPESDPIYCFKRKTMDAGMRHVRSFIDAAEESWRATMMGQPIGADDTKGQPGGQASSATTKKAPAKRRSGPKKKGG